jgi:hypothetical protein
MSGKHRLRARTRGTSLLIVLALVVSAGSGTFCAAASVSTAAMSCCVNAGDTRGPIAKPCCAMDGDRSSATQPVAAAVLHAPQGLPAVFGTPVARIAATVPSSAPVLPIDIRLLTSVFLI